MFVIFGWNHITVREHGAAFPVTCPRCHNTGYWHLRKLTSWFTFFFVPVIPYEEVHQLYCRVCSLALIVRGAHLADCVAMTRATSMYAEGTMPESRYRSLAVSKRPPHLPWWVTPAAASESNATSSAGSD